MFNIQLIVYKNNYKLSADAKFCDRCGAMLVRKCPNCGADVRENSVFCSGCGEKLEKM